MAASAHVTVRIDLGRIRKNVTEIKELVIVPVLAVIKADAYGLGAKRVAPAIADLVDGFCVFSVSEAAEAEVWLVTGKVSIALGPNPGANADDFIAQGLRPAVWTVERAESLRRARPVLSIDTGMQRFACAPDQIDAIRKTGGCDEAMTHATRLEHVHRLRELAGDGLRLHAAGSALMREPQARLDAVRPGLALYRGAVRISVPLVEVHVGSGPAGYSRFIASHHGVILAGYSNGLQKGPCLINGRSSRIIEVGMQSSYIETNSTDRVGDEVLLLGEPLTETHIANEWKTSPHEVLTRLCSAGRREYVD